MKNYSYNPKPQNNTRCIICGEKVANDLIVGCQMVKGGKVCAHVSCWEKEQSERRAENEKTHTN